jgi:hypothetical protein
MVSTWPGSLSLHAFMTFYLQSVQESPFSPRVDVAGSNVFATSGAAANALPNWKLNVTADYAVDDWTISLTGRAFDDGEFNNTNGMYVVCTAGCPAVVVGKPTINYNDMAGRFYLDASVKYGFEFGNAKAEAFVSIKNLFDNDPPPLPAGANLATLYDTLGRVYRAGVRIRL